MDKILIINLKVNYDKIVILYCENKTALHIVANPIYHERVKHIELDCHLIKEKIQGGGLKTKHMKSVYQATDVVTKTLSTNSMKQHLSKMGAKDLYSPSYMVVSKGEHYSRGIRHRESTENG